MLIKMLADKPLPGLLIVMLMLWLLPHATPVWLAITVQISFGVTSIIFGGTLLVRGLRIYRTMWDARRHRADQV